MKLLQLKPEIYHYDTCGEFARDLKLGRGDLVLTNRYIYEPCFGALNLSCDVIFQENYGQGEPTDEMAEAIYQDIASIGKHRRIIGIGGGTVLDLAKLFALKTAAPILDLFDGKIPPCRDKELVLVPTTCGTGSEVTNISILALLSRHTKKGLAVPELYADKAVLIPELLQSLPFRVFATSSIDALIHAIESSLSPKASPMTRLFGYKAIHMILSGYQAIRAQGPEARLTRLSDFLLASNYAGIAFGNAGCAAVHALSYPLGAVYHVPHGESNYAMFTGVMKNYRELKTDGELAVMNAYLARELNCPENQVLTEMEKLLNCLIPKKALHEYGVKKEELPVFAASVVQNQQRLLVNNPVPFDEARILKIYQELY